MMKKFLFGMFLMLTVVLYIPSTVRAADTDDYIAGGMINEDYGQLTWIIDGNGKLTVEGWGDYAYFVEDDDGGYWKNTAPPWTGYYRTITSVEIKVTGMTYVGGFFFGCIGLESLDLSNFDTSQVTDMSGMFWGCSSLVSLDVSNFDTSKVTDMGEMFRGCSSLVSLDVSNFDTSKVTDMGGMFLDCSSLVSLDVSNFDTSKVTDMGGMFRGCSSLASLDVSNFGTSQVADMGAMFSGCSGLTSLAVSNFGTSQVTDMAGMFKRCSSLVSLDVSNFDTSQVTDMGEMFLGCSGLTSLDVSNFDTSQVTDVGGMFGCDALSYLDLSNFDLGQALWNRDGLVVGCDSLSILRAPKCVTWEMPLPAIFYMPNGQATTVVPTKLDDSILLTRNPLIHVSEDVTEAVTVPFQNQSMNIVWDDGLFEKDAFSYNNNLAVAGLALSAAAEESQGNINYILKQMGFQNKDICHYNYDSSFNINAPACSIASKEMMVGGSKKTLVAVTVRGSSSAGDWITDVIASGDGFSTPAKYIASLVEEYRKTYCASVASEDLLFLITGHSLGGAVASKLDQELCSAYSSGNLYVYSFAPPKYSAGENTVYKNVFEICNGYDIVPYYGGLGSSHAGVLMSETRGFNGSSSVYLEYYRLFAGEDAQLPLPMKSMSHHNVSLYMAYLMANAKSVTGDVVSDGKNTYYITVRCPVDVEIYDAENKLLCSIIDNVYYDHDFPDKDDDYDYDNDDDDYDYDYDDDYDYYSIGRRECVAGIYVEGAVNGDEKHLIVSSDSEIKVRLLGTDEGEMSYSVMKLGDIGEAVTERDMKAFQTVVLERDKEFCSEILPGKSISDIALYVMDTMTGSVIREVGTNGEEKDVKPTNVPDQPEETDDPPNTQKPQGTERPQNTQKPQETKTPVVLPGNAPDITQPSDNINPAPNQTIEPPKVSIPSVKKVRSVKVKAVKKKLILKWKKSPGISGYQIQISTKKNFKGSKKISISKSKNTYIAKRLKEKKKYYIRIRAYKAYEDANKETQNVYGKWTTINKKIS